MPFCFPSVAQRPFAAQRRVVPCNGGGQQCCIGAVWCRVIPAACQVMLYAAVRITSTSFRRVCRSGGAQRRVVTSVDVPVVLRGPLQVDAYYGRRAAVVRVRGGLCRHLAPSVPAPAEVTAASFLLLSSSFLLCWCAALPLSFRCLLPSFLHCLFPDAFFFLLCVGVLQTG
jgi:hypothetical protein